MASSVDWAKLQEVYERYFAKLEGLQKKWDAIVPGGTEEDIAESLVGDTDLAKETEILQLGFDTDDLLSIFRDWISVSLSYTPGIDSAKERVRGSIGRKSTVLSVTTQEPDLTLAATTVFGPLKKRPFFLGKKRLPRRFRLLAMTGKGSY